MRERLLSTKEAGLGCTCRAKFAGAHAQSCVGDFDAEDQVDYVMIRQVQAHRMRPLRVGTR